MSEDEKKKQPDPALDQTLTTPLEPAAVEDDEGHTATAMRGALKAPTLTDPVIGANVSGYVVKSRLGTGGMGIVYEGQHEVIGKRAAIKVLRPEFAENPDQLARLVAEARAVNEVHHRGIIDVFGYGQLPDGRQCIVMEYLDGQPLEDVLKEHKKQHRFMELAEVLEVLDEVLSALSAAHSANVVHRDLKPSNIFLVKQRDTRFVKLLDFGIAKLGALGGSTPVSRASMIAGTPTYMAPEQARGAAAAPTMDLYSVGVIAFEMLCNQPPFDSDSVMGMLMAHAETPPKKPSSLRQGVPDALDELVLRLLAKKPNERFKTAEYARAEVVRLKAHLKDPVAPRTLQDDDDVPSVQSEILPMSQSGELEDQEKLKATVMKPMAAAPAPVRAPAPAVNDTMAELKGPAVHETMVVPKRVADPPMGTSQLIERTNKTPFFLMAAAAGAMFVAAAWMMFGGGGGGGAPTPPPAPVAKRPAPPPPPEPPAPVVVAEVRPPPPPTPQPEVAPTPPPPPPKVEPAPPPPPAPKPEVVRPKVAAPPPAPSTPKLSGTAGGLLSRLKRLEARLDKAQQTGGDVGLYLKQVQRIRQKLEAGPLSADDQTRVEVALDSLEKSSDY